MPLIAVGSLGAHSLAYRVAVPDEHARHLAYEAAGHGYLRYAPIVFAICVALVLAGVIGRALRVAAGRPRGDAALWPFLVFPLTLYLIQEHAERFVSTGSFPVGAILEPTCLLGLVLQLPLALGAYTVARLVLRLADGLAQLLGGLVPVPLRHVTRLLRAEPPAVELPRIPILALHRAGRAPPPELPAY
jgi:hypothetical protein